MQTVNMAGCPSHMFMEENGCVMMIQAIISEKAREREKKAERMENTELWREMWRIGRYSQAVLTPRGQADRVSGTSDRY